MKYIKLFRVKHYIKNFLIFLPAFITGGLFDYRLDLRLVLGFLVFSFVSSVIYIINDMRDIESDRRHHMKKNRPLASGAVSIRAAKCSIIVLICLSIWIAYISGNFWEMLLVPLVYLLINVFYSMGLKNYPIIDVAILSSGYILRLFYGGAIADTGVSTWMFLTMISAALFMGFGKRRGELVSSGSDGRVSLKSYTESFLNQSVTISCALSIVFYSMMCAEQNTIVAKRGIDLLWSVPVIVFIVFRYLMDIMSGENDGDPVSVILNDKVLMISIVGLAIALFIALYFG